MKSASFIQCLINLVVFSGIFAVYQVFFSIILRINAYSVVATRSGKQTHSVYSTGGPKAESPLSQGP